MNKGRIAIYDGLIREPLQAVLENEKNRTLLFYVAIASFFHFTTVSVHGKSIQATEETNTRLRPVKYELVNLAKEMNEAQKLVGTSRKEMTIGRPTVVGGSSFYTVLGPYEISLLEVQFDESGVVHRFRFIDNSGNKPTIGKYSHWQTKNFRSREPSQIVLSIDPLVLDATKIRFAQLRWKSNLWDRQRMIWDLLHSNWLDSQDIEGVHSLLGNPVLSKVNSGGNGSEFYEIGTSCLVGLPETMFEIVFKKNVTDAAGLATVKLMQSE